MPVFKACLPTVASVILYAAPLMPTHGVSLFASQVLGEGFDASAAWYRQTSVDWPQGSGLTPYNRVDGRLAKKFQGDGVQGALELILQSSPRPIPNSRPTTAWMRGVLCA